MSIALLLHDLKGSVKYLSGTAPTEIHLGTEMVRALSHECLVDYPIDEFAFMRVVEDKTDPFRIAIIGHQAQKELL